MQRRILPVVLIAFLSLSLLNWGCSKLDTTNLGADLLPAVDNVHTFADTLSITTTQGVFNDTTTVERKDNFVFGTNIDPLFGRTDASIAFQLKPAFFPYYLGGYNDTLNGYGAGLDSIVLCLSYKGFYGDSLTPLDVQVKEVTDADFRDFPYKKRDVSYMPTTGTVIGRTSIDVRRLADTVYYTNGKDYSVNKIRIKLYSAAAPTVFGALLYSCDTLNAGPFNHAFKNDSLYRRAFNGLAVVASGAGNQMVYTNLADTATKLEVHFRRRNNGVLDTVISSFALNSDPFGSTTDYSSAVANYIHRNRPALPNGTQEIYLQAEPGTYANLTIPGLSALSNRIIHRAELVVQQIPEVPASPFLGPSLLYVDLRDSVPAVQWKPLYHDLNPSTLYDPDYRNPLSVPYYPSTAGIDYTYFGAYRRDRVDQFGNPVNFYTLNVTKYVQDIVTNHRYNYNMRLYAPSKLIYPQYSPLYITYGNSIAYGRVKVGGGNNPNYRMLLRIISSSL